MERESSMETNERITVRLSVKTVAALKALVDRGDFESIYDAVMKAIEDLIADRLTSEEISNIILEAFEDDIEDLIDVKQNDSMDEAIRKAVTEYVLARIKPEDKG